MVPAMPIDADPSESGATGQKPCDHRWLPTMELEPGMVIARPIYGGAGSHGSSHAAIRLSVGSAITGSTIAQLINKGIECVAVVQESPLDEGEYAAHVSQYVARLHEIFGEVPAESCRALLDALITAGPGTC